jgi:hypothetical protein
LSLTYAQYVAELSRLSVIPSSDADFTANLPSCIDYAEMRMYRELQLLATIVRDSSANATADNRNFTLPSTLGRFVVVTGINIVSPIGEDVTSGTRNALMQTTRDYIDFTWPSNEAPAVTTIPEYYAPITDQAFIFGPPPGDAFNVEVVGTIRPTSLSASNTTTFLSLYLPDVFLAASMVFMSGYKQNFGSQADNPQEAMSWEGQYTKLLASANAEELRKKFGSMVGG